MKILQRARPRNYREHLILFLCGLAALVDSLVVIGSLGFLSCDLLPWFVYGKWIDRFLDLPEYHHVYHSYYGDVDTE